MPLPVLTATPTRPSAATRPAFFAALDSPFLRSQSTAASRLPPVSLSAALQSIIPAPVWSRSSFTRPALTIAIAKSLHFFRCQFLGLGDPAFHAARQSDLLADIMRRGRRQIRDLLEMENAEIVELLLDRRRNAGQFLEIVGDPARPGQRLEAELVFRRGRNFFGNGFGLRADIDALRALRSGNPIDRRFGGEIAVKRDGPARIVIAGNDKSDVIGIAISVNDRGNRNAEPLR